MKKNIVVCGLIGGLILATVMVVSTSLCYAKNDFEGNMVLGYASMILAFSLIFVGVKNYRDKFSDGVISFGKAFKIGFFISLIASTMYVLTWLVDYYFFIPDFMDKYTAHILQQARAEGLDAAAMQAKAAEMDSYKAMYKNPLVVVLFTYLEVLPIGLIVSLICALILKKKEGVEARIGQNLEN